MTPTADGSYHSVIKRPRMQARMQKGMLTAESAESIETKFSRFLGVLGARGGDFLWCDGCKSRMSGPQSGSGQIAAV